MATMFCLESNFGSPQHWRRLRPTDDDFLQRPFGLPVHTAHVRWRLLRAAYFHCQLMGHSSSAEATPASLSESLAECNARLERAIQTMELLVGQEDPNVVMPACEWMTAIDESTSCWSVDTLTK